MGKRPHEPSHSSVLHHLNACSHAVEDLGYTTHTINLDGLFPMLFYKTISS